MRFVISIVIASLLFLVSCSVKAKLNPYELSWLDAYKVGDTMIFRSDLGELDTSVIIKKDMFFENYGDQIDKSFERQWGVIWYKNKNLEYHPDGDRLLTIEKQYPQKGAFVSIDFLYSGVLILHLNADTMQKLEKNGLYEFDVSRSDGRPKQPKMIYWSRANGVVKYINHDNSIWELVKRK